MPYGKCEISPYGLVTESAYGGWIFKRRSDESNVKRANCVRPFQRVDKFFVYTLTDDEKRAQTRKLTLSAYGLYGKRQLTK